MLRSRGKSRPSASSTAPPNAALPPLSSSKADPASSSAASLEARRQEKLKRARELERLRQLEQAKMLLDDEMAGDEDEARRFASMLKLKPDAELPDTVRETIDKYRNAHHLNYSDILNDGWYDDGGLIPGVNAAKVGRERGGGRWEGDVIVFDAQNDPALSDIVETAKALVRQQDTVKGRVQILAQLVSNKLGGLPNDVVNAWERVMKKALRYRQQRMAAMGQADQVDVDQRIILPVGALLGEGGLTRPSRVPVQVPVRPDGAEPRGVVLACRGGGSAQSDVGRRPRGRGAAGGEESGQQRRPGRHTPQPLPGRLVTSAHAVISGGRRAGGVRR